jgi:hypothetical protein
LFSLFIDTAALRRTTNGNAAPFFFRSFQKMKNEKCINPLLEEHVSMDW